MKTIKNLDKFRDLLIFEREFEYLNSFFKYK